MYNVFKLKKGKFFKTWPAVSEARWYVPWLATASSGEEAYSIYPCLSILFIACLSSAPYKPSFPFYGCRSSQPPTTPSPLHAAPWSNVAALSSVLPPMPWTLMMVLGLTPASDVLWHLMCQTLLLPNPLPMCTLHPPPFITTSLPFLNNIFLQQQELHQASQNA